MCEAGVCRAESGELARKFGYDARLIGTVAQLVEQGPFKALVLGSSPSRPTNKNNDLRNNPPAETVRTEICTETFKGLCLKSSRRPQTPKSHLVV
jgi:hypothetical protein